MEYQKQLKKEDIQLAYKGLMKFLSSLRTYRWGKYPDYAVSGNIYQGYMGISYFSVTPSQFKEKNLKIAIVFLHEPLQYEIWLTAVNKKIQKKYWYIFHEKGFGKHPLTKPGKGKDAIIVHPLVKRPDFGDWTALKQQIENGALEFIQEVTPFIY